MCIRDREKTVETIYVAITDTMDMLPQYDYEILFVNDGSKDNTLNKLTGLSEMDVHVKYYSFSRNFGKEAAIYAGLNLSLIHIYISRHRAME